MSGQLPDLPGAADAGGPRFPGPRRWMPALAAGLATAAVHVFVVLAVFPGDSQFDKYPAAARMLLDGVLPAERHVDFSPLYLGVHVLAAALLPWVPALLTWLQVALLGAAASLLHRCLSDRWGGRAAALGAAAFALNGAVLLYGYLHEPEALLLFFLTAAAFLMDGRTAVRRVAAGCCVGLAILTRPSALPLAAAFPVLAWAAAGDREGRRRDPWLIAIVPVLAVAALAGWNHRHTGSWSPAVMNPGYVFFEGNNPLSPGKSASYPPLVSEYVPYVPDQPDPHHVAYRVLARRAAGRALSTADTNRYWAGKALAYLQDHPGAAARAFLGKVFSAFHRDGTHDLFQAFGNEAALDGARFPRVPFSLLSALALCGLWLGRREWRRDFAWYAILATQVLVMAAVCVTERQRCSAVPFVVFFAVLGGRSLMQRPRRRAAALGLALGLAAALSLPNGTAREGRYLYRAVRVTQDLMKAASEARAAGDLAGASRRMAEALACSPASADGIRLAEVPAGSRGFAATALAAGCPLDSESSSARFDRALLAIEAGNLDEAEAGLQGLRAEGRRFARGSVSREPAYHLGRIAFLRGDREQAVRWMGEALARSPGDPFALAALAALTGEDRHREALARYFGEPNTDLFLGTAYLAFGPAGAAVAPLHRVTSLLPEYRRGRIYLAAGLAQAGEDEAAAALYLEATAERQEPMMRETDITALFRRLAGARPGDGLAAYWAGIVLAQYGLFEEALGYLRQAQGLMNDPRVGQEIAWVQESLARSR